MARATRILRVFGQFGLRFVDFRLIVTSILRVGRVGSRPVAGSYSTIASLFRFLRGVAKRGGNFPFNFFLFR